MVVELQDTENYEHADWPTGLSFSLMPVEDDSHDDLSTNDTGMVVLHDRLITDASTANKVLINPIRRYANRVQPNANSSIYSETSLITSRDHTSTFNITIGSRGEVEICEDTDSSIGIHIKLVLLK